MEFRSNWSLLVCTLHGRPYVGSISRDPLLEHDIIHYESISKRFVAVPIRASRTILQMEKAGLEDLNT